MDYHRLFSELKFSPDKKNFLLGIVDKLDLKESSLFVRFLNNADGFKSVRNNKYLRNFKRINKAAIKSFSFFCDKQLELLLDDLTEANFYSYLFLCFLFKHFETIQESLLSLAIKINKFFNGPRVHDFSLFLPEGPIGTYKGGVVSVGLKFLTEYLLFLNDDYDSSKRANFEFDVIEVLAHEMAHGFSFKLRGEISDLSESCVKYLEEKVTLDFFKSDLITSKFIKHVLKSYEPDKFLSFLKGLRVELPPVDFEVSDRDFLVLFPERAWLFVFNLYQLKLMVNEFPAISLSFIYLIKYYSDKLGSKDEAVKHIAKLLGVGHSNRLSKLFLVFSRKARGYDIYARFRYPEVRRFFKKYAKSDSFFDALLFMKKVNNLGDISGLKKEWFDLLNKLKKILSKYNIKP